MASPDDVAVAAREVLRDAVFTAPRGTQAKIARSLGVSAQTVSSWLSGDLAIHPRWFLQLEDILSIDSWSFARATGLAEALGLDDLNDYELQLERWQLVFGGDDDALPARREARSYKPSAKVRELEDRLSALEEQLEAALGGPTKKVGRRVKRPSPEPNE